MSAQGWSDALVMFGATGDLARKMLYPALYHMSRRGSLGVPVIGVGMTSLTAEQFRARVAEGVRRALKPDARALRGLLAKLRYVEGDFNTTDAFEKIRSELKGRRRPTFYLAIPPAAFATVIRHLGDAGLGRGARLIVEKPFGRDLASARALNQVAHSVFPEESIFRIDHFLAKEAIENVLYFRFANSFLEPIWNRNYVSSVQVTLAESFGVEGRGAFYDGVGCLRDVIQNHLFQIVALLAMEPPAGRDVEALRNEKVKVFQAIEPLRAKDVVRGQFIGYRREPGVARDSDTETYCALVLRVDSWRWSGVPWYLRSGKHLAESVGEIVVQLKAPPQRLFADACHPAVGRTNYLRFRINPCPEIALAARVKRPGEEFVGEQRELELFNAHPDVQTPYERLLGDALQGNGALFTREDAVEAAWAALDRVIARHHRAIAYRRGGWGPREADALVAEHGGWFNPKDVAATGSRR